MKIMYIFPHPDDESFGPGPAISSQIRNGHEVFLLTLTKGGATKERHKYGFSIEEMGEVRYKEMLEVASVLGLTELKVLDLPDSGLKDMDPREIEEEVGREIKRIRPDIVITYAVHGISGFFDHIVIHSIIKRLFLEMKDRGERYLKRLAFFTLNEQQAVTGSTVHQLKFSADKDIDCIVKAEETDVKKGIAALDCYVTYKDMIEKTNIRQFISTEICFEIFGEQFSPPLNDLTEGIP